MTVINKSQCIKRLTQLCKRTGSVYPLSRSNHLRLRSLRIITSNPSSGQAAFTLLWWHLQAPAASLAPRLLWEAHLRCESHRLSFFLVENDWRRWMTILCLGQRSSLVYCCVNLIFFSEFCIFCELKGAPISCVTMSFQRERSPTCIQFHLGSNVFQSVLPPYQLPTQAEGNVTRSQNVCWSIR